jgi:hypothetical protein
MLQRRRRVDDGGDRRPRAPAPARPGLDSPAAVLALQRAAGNRAVARQIEMRDAGRGEASGLPRLPELVERLTAISQSLTFRMEGAQLACEQSPNIEADEFDRQMVALCGGPELIPLRLTTRENRMEDEQGRFTEQISGDNWQHGYVDVDDLLASDDLGLKLQLVHFLTERSVTRNYARRMGIDDRTDPAHLTEAEFNRGHAQGSAAEVRVLQDFFGDPTIRLIRDVDAATFRVFRNARGDEIREIEHQGTGAQRGVQSDTVEVVTRDGVRHTPDEYKAILDAARAAPAPP